ncbi:MAG: hypothetical protein L0Y71_13035 [Gemmataceae bacterium]|nr:hypothetical protein [Gemmataceae bacterium]
MPEHWTRGIWKVVKSDPAHLIYAGKTHRHVRVTTEDAKVQVEFVIGGNLSTAHMAPETTMDVEAEKVMVQAFEENGVVIQAHGSYEILLQDQPS